MPTVPPILPCKRCNGDGHSLSKGFTTDDGKHYPSRWQTCGYCAGVGWFHAPDLQSLVNAVKGRKPRTLRSKRPDDSRAYFVWRLARFHGGADACLPMVAELDSAGDPYRATLDQLAQIVAKGIYGSCNVGAARWQQAMYGSHGFGDLPPILDGPVHDGNKALEEMLETI
jgi:hypothetical protein